MMIDKTAIRNASTVIVVRDRATAPRILMGQRGAQAAFMPNKFVFPGGAVDPGDADVPLAGLPAEPNLSRLQESSPPELAHALAVAAIRELAEETGLLLGQAGVWPDASDSWSMFAGAGLIPDGQALQFVFRAVTPAGRSRRFDARFFLLDADHIANDLDDFLQAEDELSHLQWIPLAEARNFDLPFITEVVLAELSATIHDPAAPESVPFFQNDDERHLVSRLGGVSPLNTTPR
jgi:8-oxo-dGTP pyrophosphatase MutT (NUDIX family)